MIKKKSGFTLIEILVVVSVMAILFSLGLAQYMKFNRQQILEQAILELKTDLTDARSKALSGKKECTEGVFDGVLVDFSPGNYVLYSSCGGGLDLKLISDTQLSSGVKITESPEDGILFKPITGGTDIQEESGATITLSGYGTTKNLEVYPDGKIDLISE
ncbi:MAG TPA: type II secretion system protein [Patescibacteria group bacterium]|nr:type II secretion system protein [Patescibacteria group bacterium]